MAKYDLSSLPDIPLLKIFEMLPGLSDRSSLASCNQRLWGLVDTSKVWKEVAIDDFDLDVHELECCIPLVPPRRIIVDKLRARDIIMVKRCCRHFQKVEVVLHTGMLESESMAVLAELGKRHVIKSVSLRLDMFASKVIDWQAENRSVGLQELLIQKSFTDGLQVLSPGYASGIYHLPEFNLTDCLSPDTDLTIALPPQSHNLEDFLDNGFKFRKDFRFSTVAIYTTCKSEKYCSLVKTLMLSPLPVPEEVADRYLSSCNLRQDAQLSSPPTAELIASFPNLEELHINIVSLSDQLLQELSGAQGRRKPLRSLVIRHIVCDCKVERFDLNQYLQFCLSPSDQGTFPKLSSAAWVQLAQFSPSLTVECSVMSDKLPLLSDVIKPETPLVRLEVLCHSTSLDEQSEVLHELRKTHSHLTKIALALG